MKDIKLTQYSHGAGCGCKISPKLLDSILKTTRETVTYPDLIVGNSSKDDAAAFDLVMAISIFGWPINKLDADVAREVIDGGRSVCDEAGIPLAGGHSIDSPEPIFGLAVTGIAKNEDIKRNDTAEADCELFLTKPLGIGILTTAQKEGKISQGDINVAIDAMCTLNKIGAEISQLKGVTALTDVTGFGLLGHLSEICEGSNISAIIEFDKVPTLKNVKKYLEMGCVPGGTRRNFESYGHKISPMNAQQQDILCDAQTSGGLLCAVRKDTVDDFLAITKNAGLDLYTIGKTTTSSKYLVEVV